MAWTIEISKDAQKDLRRIDRTAATRIVRFLDERVVTSLDPRTLAEPLAGNEFAGLWRFRVGDYRIIADIEHDVLKVLVLEIGPRGSVYRS